MPGPYAVVLFLLAADSLGWVEKRVWIRGARSEDQGCAETSVIAGRDVRVTLPGMRVLIVPDDSETDWQVARPRRGALEFDWSRYTTGQYDRDLPRRCPLDEVQCEFAARTASECRAESIHDLLRKRNSVPTSRRGGEFGGWLDELSVGDATAQANAHGSTLSTELETKCKYE